MARPALQCSKCGVPVFDLPIHLAWHDAQERRHRQLGIGLQRVQEQLASLLDMMRPSDEEATGP